MEMTWSFNYKTSLISGNTLFNNVVSLVPETDRMLLRSGVERFPAYLQLTEDNVFKTIRFRSSAAG